MTSRAAGTGAPGMMRAEISKAVQKLYAVGILVYFAAAGIGGVSISDFSDWASFMGRHAVYAFAWPVAAGAEINSGGPRARCHGGCANVVDVAIKVEQHG